MLFKGLPELAKIKVRTSLKDPEQVKNSQQHVFTEASKGARSAVAYLRHEYESSHTTVCFVISKAKVAPLESIRIPRVELMAAIVGLQIAETA